MKFLLKIRSSFAIALLIIIATGLLAFNDSQIDTKKLTAETNHSTLLFAVPIANGITRITGKFNEYNIDIDLVDNDWTKSSMKAVIKTVSIDTGIDGRDEHLRTADFFDAETYPEITFTSDRIEKSATGFVAHGSFSMHGVTKKIEVPFVIVAVDGENTIGISSRLSINRIDYGVGADFKHSAIENFLGDEISVEIDFWTKKRKEKKE